MNLFWKKLFGGITPTARLEKDETDLLKAMHRYAEVEKSKELVRRGTGHHIAAAGSLVIIAVERATCAGNLRGIDREVVQAIIERSEFGQRSGKSDGHRTSRPTRWIRYQ